MNKQSRVNNKSNDPMDYHDAAKHLYGDVAFKNLTPKKPAGIRGVPGSNSPTLSKPPRVNPRKS